MLVLCKLSAVLAFLPSPVQVWGAESQEFTALRSLSSSPEAQPQQVLVFDAGSSGTRIHIFNILPAAEGSLAPRIDLTVRDQQTKKIKPGLSSFAKDNDLAGCQRNIEQLLEFASQYVPADRRSSTPALLKATAGLRAVKPTEQAEAILQRVRETLAKSGFIFKSEWADIIKGHEEAGLAWVAGNYLQGNFLAPTTSASSLGIIEMGGGSTQVTFEVSDSEADQVAQPDKFVFNTLAGTSFRLYAHSYLGYGQDHAQAKMRRRMLSSEAEDPCYPEGYFRQTVEDPTKFVKGSGNAELCQELLKSRLFAATENLAPSRYADGLSLRGQFVATENFFYLREDYKLPMDASITAMKDVAKDNCAKPLSPSVELEAAMTAGTADPSNGKSCFGFCYQAALLEALGATTQPGVEVQIARQIKGGDIDWALGAALVHFIDNKMGDKAEALPATAASGNLGKGLVLVLVLLSLAAIAARFFLGPQCSKQVAAAGSAIGVATIGKSWIELGNKPRDGL